MAYCGPSFAIPSCASVPAVGFGSAGQNYGYGYSGLQSGTLVGAGAPSFAVSSVASAPVVGFGSAGFGHGYGSGVPSASLGTLAGVEPSCINQIPPAEVMIQPPPTVVTLPGAILSATGRPVKVGGHTPCAVSYGGSVVGLSGGSGLYGGFNRGLSGVGAGAFRGRLGSISGHRGSICLPTQ